ncbi:PREDICTED: probable carboxylesterase 17 [Populus euphratica]|uniref:Probable carboxylesterase 17 n=1 Tax=Populus euphratica TaxID=75702 RepID=A0AAJ6THZ3_POPEU|nr:PREDICTED: probable carboxylesterase 17 [Populus euphratica]
MRRKQMAAISFDPRINRQTSKNSHEVIIEEIEGLIRVYKDGHIERPPIIPSVPCNVATVNDVSAKDIFINKFTNLWARIYVSNRSGTLPLLVYFHGGGFCVGSAAWSSYHEFLANLASKASCIILSINYRLAPENRLPSAYDDGIDAFSWVKQQVLNGSPEHNWWLSRCNFSSVFLSGDSAGANIAYNVATRLESRYNPESMTKPLCLKGIILIQPFFGGEARTFSEKNMTQPANSALTLSASDTYWRLSLPLGSNRDHPYCNPLANGASKLRDLRLPAIMVGISELDILKDRNSEFCSALTRAGKRVEKVTYKGVGHAFQILHNYHLSHTRVQEMASHIKTFIKQ